MSSAVTGFFIAKGHFDTALYFSATVLVTSKRLSRSLGIFLTQPGNQHLFAV